MKRQFALVVLDDGAGGVMSNDGLERLRATCTTHKVAANPRILTSGSIVLIAGNPQPEQLQQHCEELLAGGFDVQIVDDALVNRNQLTEALFRLNERGVKLTRVEAVKGLVSAEHLVVSRYPAADSTATVAVLINAATRWQRKKIRICQKIYSKERIGFFDKLLLKLFDKALVLTIVRKDEPDAGCIALPGGFHATGLETLEEAAARELKEECSVAVEPSFMKLVDVRSDPWRDPRNHVIDHGYAVHVAPESVDAVVSQVVARDDAKAASFTSVAKTLAQEMAFDHDVMLRRAVGLE